MKIITVPADAEIEVKRSRFIASVSHADTEEKAQLFIEGVRKTHRDARHNCFAMRIGTGPVIFERSSDDGEPQGTAGRPMLDMLKGNGITDAVCVVTRYFGGTLLGTGGLLRAYSDALREALSRSEILELMEGREAFGDISYDLISKVKHVATGSSVRIMSEEYGEVVRMSFLSDREGLSEFSRKLSELSAGKIRLFDEQDVLYYGTDSPKVYKKL